MKVLIGSIILALAVASSYAEVNAVEDLTIFQYHKNIGIPKATKIRQHEEALERGEVSSAQRIVGGSVTNISEVPYQVGLLITILWIFTSVCGGSLISETRVLTAAHCYYDGTLTAQGFTAVLGSTFLFSGGTRLDTNTIAVHPDWNPEMAANDCAVLSIPSVAFTNQIQPISLPSGSELEQDFVDEIALASGFGITSDGSSIGVLQVLSSVSLPVISNADCASVFGEWVHDSNVCVSGEGGKSTCSGDSGGPLVVNSEGNNIVIGITSYGAAAGCSVGFPAAFGRVTSFIPWIQTVL